MRFSLRTSARLNYAGDPVSVLLVFKHPGVLCSGIVGYDSSTPDINASIRQQIRDRNANCVRELVCHMKREFLPAILDIGDRGARELDCFTERVLR